MIFDELTNDLMESSFLRKPTFEKVNEFSRGELGTMLYLDFEKNCAFLGEISTILDLSSGRLASVLKNLDKKGFIKRIKCKKDGCQTIVSLTEKGVYYQLYTGAFELE